jgi:hypothetical protein
MGNTKVIAYTVKYLLKVPICIKAVNLSVKMKDIALLAATVTIIPTISVIETKRRLSVIMEGAKRLVFFSADVFNIW